MSSSQRGLGSQTEEARAAEGVGVEHAKDQKREAAGQQEAGAIPAQHPRHRVARTQLWQDARHSGQHKQAGKRREVDAARQRAATAQAKKRVVDKAGSTLHARGEEQAQGATQVGNGIHRAEVRLLDGKHCRRVQSRRQQRGAPLVQGHADEEHDENSGGFRQRRDAAPDQVQAKEAAVRRVAAHLRQQFTRRARQEQRQRAIDVEAFAHVMGVQRGACRIEVGAGAATLWIALLTSGNVRAARGVVRFGRLKPAVDRRGDIRQEALVRVQEGKIIPVEAIVA